MFLIYKILRVLYVTFYYFLWLCSNIKPEQGIKILAVHTLFGMEVLYLRLFPLNEIFKK